MKWEAFGYLLSSLCLSSVGIFLFFHATIDLVKAWSLLTNARIRAIEGVFNHEAVKKVLK